MNNYKGFYKVYEYGGALVKAILYNPDTNEEFSAVVRDYDYDDGSRDNDELYNLIIDKDVKRIWEHHKHIINVGDTIKINRGRKMVGETKIVKSIKEITPTNGFYLSFDYLYFQDGTRCLERNCDLLENYEDVKRVDLLELIERN